MKFPARSTLRACSRTFSAMLGAGLALTGLAQQAPTNAVDVITLPDTLVLGEGPDHLTEAGSAALVTARQIQNQTYANPNRVLQQIPGVYARDEDGYGNFPNFSLRGTDSVRSAKTTVMEDGVLMSTATYSFPADYHTPRIGRMSGIEVFKGSTQLRHGPHTTGGALNYLSTPFVALPTENTGPLTANAGYFKSTYGSDNTWFNHGWWGHSQRTEAGPAYGVLLELYHNQSDGFRKVDQSDVNTGFTVVEPMIRLFWEPDTALPQRLEFRFGYSDFDTAETHLGLTDADLDAQPERRYVSTQFDDYTSDQFRYSLRHTMKLRENVRVETTAYYSYYQRDWYKLTDIRTPGGQTIPLATALATPGEPLDILRGDAAGSWRIRANDRDYDMGGVQSQLDWNFETGGLEHALTAGLRLHYDDAQRFERDDIATVNDQGEVIDFQTGRQGAAGNRGESVLAWAMFAEDQIRMNRFVLKPGLRWEHMRMEYQDRATTGPDLGLVIAEESGDLDALAPGIALGYDLTGTVNLFGSYYRGISSPAPREYLRGDAQLETSDGFELGFRHTTRFAQVQVAGFHTTIYDMIANEGLGGLGAIVDSNAGDGRLYGVEGAARWDALQDTTPDWHLPLRASATYTHSEFLKGNPLATPGSIYANALPGNELPYVPAWTASFGIGLEHRKFAVYLDATYLGEMQGSASNATDLRDPNENPDARYGKTEAAVIVDLSANYEVARNVRLLAGISNLTDETYITSRLPAGARANRPRACFGGLQVRF